MGQQQKISAQNIGESYPAPIPVHISQLEKCLQKGNFTKVEASSEEGTNDHYLLRSQQSTHLVFGICFHGGDESKVFSGPVQIYKIEHSRHRTNRQLCFEGQLQKGKRTGYGIEYYKNDIFYQGFFFKNKYHGWGKTKNYEGQWAACTKCGYGKYDISYPVGDKKLSFTYEGNWKNDRFDGLGAKNITLADSKKFMSSNYTSDRGYEIDEQYIGEWLQGVKFGFGKSIKYVPNSNPIQRQVYEGEFARNHYQGRGRLEGTDGKIYEGKFDHGCYVGQL